MKKFILNLLAICAIALGFCSCSSTKSQDKEITVSSVNIDGDSAAYISVPNGTYTIVGKVADKNAKISMNVKIKLEKKVNLTSLKFEYSDGFEVELLDEAGASLSTTLELNDGEQNKLKRFLLSGNVGDEQEFTFENTSISDDDYKAVFEKAGGFEVNYVDFEYDEEESSAIDTDESASDDNNDEEATEDNTDEETEASNGSTDYDEVLDAYEKYYSQYISMLKKASKGDMNAIQEASDLMQQANELSEKMANAKGEMSVAQWARFQKIQMKLLKAAQEMK